MFYVKTKGKLVRRKTLMRIEYQTIHLFNTTMKNKHRNQTDVDIISFD